MKKLTRRQFTAAGILAAMSLTGAGLKSCNPFAPDDNEIEGVYGPPEDFDPSGNETVDVYGPPEDEETTDDPGNEDEGDKDDDGYDPAANELVDVYGPPADTDAGIDGYDVTINEPACVYGPPPESDSSEPASAG